MVPSWRERILRRSERVGSSEDQKAELNRIYDLVAPHELGAALKSIEPADGESVWMDKQAGAVTRRLAEIGTPEAEDVLIGFLDDPGVDVRRAAANRRPRIPQHGQSLSSTVYLLTLTKRYEWLRSWP